MQIRVLFQHLAVATTNKLIELVNEQAYSLVFACFLPFHSKTSLKVIINTGYTAIYQGITQLSSAQRHSEYVTSHCGLLLYVFPDANTIKLAPLSSGWLLLFYYITQHTYLSTPQHTYFSTPQHIYLSTSQHTYLSTSQHTYLSTPQHTVPTLAHHNTFT